MNLNELAHDFATANPLHGPDEWATRRTSWCLSAMYRFNRATVAYATAGAALSASAIEAAGISAAPVGAFVYFSNSHVAQVVVAGPNPLLFMASHYLAESNGHGLGFNTFAGYLAASGARSLGWSRTYGANPPRPASDLGTFWTPPPAPAEDDAAVVRRIARYLNRRVLGNDTAAARTGIRGPVYWRIMQRAGKQDGLYGAGYLVTGVPGPRTRWLEQHYATIAP